MYVNKILLLVFSIISFSNCSSQNIEEISTQICDSIQSVSNQKDSLELIKRQIEIQAYFSKQDDVLSELSDGNAKHDINVFNYKLNRKLNKTCPDYNIPSSAILRFSGIIDIENIFTNKEINTISNTIRELERDKNVEVLVVTVDDFYPNKTIEGFALSKIERWKIGSGLKKGGILLVLSKSLRKARIEAKYGVIKTLSDSESQEIMDTVLIPKFRNGKFYQGVLDFINELNSRI